MKRFSLLIVLFLAGLTTANAQKFAYVDTDYILNQMPEYRSAQKQLDDLAKQWQDELDAKYRTIDRKYQELQAEEVLLTPDMKKQRQDDIEKLETEAQTFNDSKFGFEGELFRKHQEFIKPIQDRVYDAVQKVARANALDFIFDKASGMTMLYANAKYDKSDEVLEELGVVAGKDANYDPNAAPKKPTKEIDLTGGDGTPKKESTPKKSDELPDEEDE